MAIFVMRKIFAIKLPVLTKYDCKVEMQCLHTE